LDGNGPSPLALKQAEIVRTALIAAHPDLAEPGAIDIVPIRTTGDRIQDRTLAEAGGKGLFTKEIEEALLAGAVDLAVHSAKDMQTWLPDGLAIGAVLPREDPRDVLISNSRAANLGALPIPAQVGALRLKAVWGTAVQGRFVHERVFGAASFDGRLRIVQTSPKVMLSILEPLREKLAQACE